jgi:asparagine synthase (glutamine-hydrolysing)
MFDFLARNVPEPGHTIYQGIHILPPGHFLVFQGGAVRLRPYWSPRPGKAMTIPPDPAARLRELLIAALKKRLLDERKIIVELSGGLDSSALLGFLTGIVGPERLFAVTRAFAPAYRDEQRDELAYAEEAARHCGLSLAVVDEEVMNPLLALEKYFDWMGNFSPNPYYDISTPMNRRMAALGASAVVAGVGGDEGVSLPGDIALPQLFSRGRWLVLWRTLGEISKVYGHSRWTLFRHWLLPKLPPAWLDDGIAALRLPEETQLQGLVLLRSDARRAIGGGQKKYQLRHERTMAKEIAAGVLGPLFVQTGEITQFFAWRHGLCFIHPFLDQDVIAYTAALPPETFLMDGWRRGLFRRAIAGAVPENIARRRTKSPFSLPFPLYIRAAEEMIMDMCHQNNHPAWDYLDRRALAFFTRRVCREEISHQIELTAVVVGKTAAMAMFLANRQRYWRDKK